MAHPLRVIPTFTYFPFKGYPEPNAVCLFSHLQEISLPATYSGFQMCIHLNFFASTSLSPLWDADYQGCYLVRQCCAGEQVMQAYELRICLPGVMNFNALEVFKTSLEQQQAASESESATVKKGSPRECKWSDVALHARKVALFCSVPSYSCTFSSPPAGIWRMDCEYSRLWCFKVINPHTT